MPRLIIIFTLFLASGVAFSQSPIAHEHLDANNISARFNANGNNFWNIPQPDSVFNVNTAQYKFPANAATSTIFSSSLWMGGVVQDSIYTAVSLAGVPTSSSNSTSSREFWTGPIPANGQPSNAYASKWNKIWKVTKSEVQAHIADYQANGQIDGPVPVSILHWPAKGNPQAEGNNGASLTINQDAAPFVDVDSNGIYEPNKGDYPAMKGDQMLWWVYNSLYGQKSATGGGQMSVEIRASAYAYRGNNDSLLNQTTFVQYEVVNKGSKTYQDFYLGSYTDFDLGCFDNDYVGSHPSTNSYYAYNGTPIDTCNYDGLNLGYGKNPPMQMVTILDAPQQDSLMTSFIYYLQKATLPDYKDYQRSYRGLKGLLRDSTNFTYGGSSFGGSQPTKYLFPSDPCDTSSNAWSELSEANAPAERNGLAGTGPVQQFSPGQTVEVEWAYLTARPDTSQCAFGFPASKVQHIRQFYKNSNDVVSSTQEPSSSSKQVQIFPNPSDEQIHITFSQHNNGPTILTLVDSKGQVQLEKQLKGGKTSLDISFLESGVYFIRLEQNNKTWNRKVIVR